MNSDNHHSSDDPQAPGRLVEALRALHADRVFVPPAQDEAILRFARAQIEEEKRRKAWRRSLMPWLAAAATLVAGAWISQVVLRTIAPNPAPWAREDINRDGRVDILDAFALARQVEHGSIRQPDLNADGRVDRLDVEAVAARAVTLEGGS